MAKASVKKVSPVKKTAPARSKSKASATPAIDAVCEQALEKLKALDLDQPLQADLAWCLGSYRYDQNPVGLLQTGSKALEVLSAVKTKGPKGVPAKLISDLKNVLKS